MAFKRQDTEKKLRGVLQRNSICSPRMKPWIKPSSNISKATAFCEKLIQLLPRPKAYHSRPIVRDSAFGLLPAELLIQIKEQLPLMTDIYIGDLFPLAGRRSTKHRSSRGHISRLQTMHHLDSELPSYTPNGTSISERVRFLGMLEWDKRISPSKLVCSACEKAQDRSIFSSAARQRSPEVRQCLGREGRTWICPHQVWNYEQALDFQQRGLGIDSSQTFCDCIEFLIKDEQSCLATV